MSFSLGIVGLPNVGKSTLFKAITKKPVSISNYPFCTIDPNIGIVEVPDNRLKELAKILHPQEIIPTTIKIIDIAGLVKNAHQGEGLGNQFLAHIREVDGLIHLVRTFAKKDIAHVSGVINPKSDIETINLELIFADLEIIKRKLDNLEKKRKAGLNKKEEKLFNTLKKIEAALEQGKFAKDINLDEEEKELIKEFNLITLKPIIYVANTDENTPSSDNSFFQVKLNAKLESELADLSFEERKELGYPTSGIDILIEKGYKILNLVTFFTSQNKILQAWTIEKNTPLPKAGGKIHSDFEEKFIKAEVINWQDLIKAGSETEARKKGLIRIEGRNYLVKDGDVIHFKI